MGCLRQHPEQRSRILGETAEVRRQEETHSSQDLHVSGEQQTANPSSDPDPATSQQAVRRNEELTETAEKERPHDSQGEAGDQEVLPEGNRLAEPRKSQVKWPPSNAEKEWQQLDEDLEGILESVLAGAAERKIEAMMEIVYSVGVERFGEKPVGKSRRQAGHPNRRERERKQIRKELKVLRKRWLKATEMEKEALEGLRKELRSRLCTLGRAERARRKRKDRERRRAEFVANPFKFTKQMLGAKTSGKLTASVEEVEIHLRATHGDQHRDSPIEDIEGMEEPAPVYPMDCSEIKLSEVKEVVQKARAGSAPGPSGITYKVYKKCPKLVRRLWKLLKVLWRKEKIPESWKKAEGVFCPKQENSLKIDQFRTISLLSVECKIYFAILAKRLLHFMLRNNYIDTSVQKGGVPGFSGCLEHTSILTQLIQEAKTEKKDLSVVWLDLENAYGSVPHQLIKMALNKCHVPQQACRVISQYLDGLQIRFTVNGNTTAWQSLQRGIITGCTISVILFVAAMNLVMKPAMRQSRGPKTSSGVRQPPLKAFMDDLTITTESVLSSRWMLKSLEEAATWARMKFKARKCRRLVLRKGRLTNTIQLEIQGERIPSVTEQPIKSLGKKFDKSLGDQNNIKEFRQQVNQGLKAIEESKLPGKFKVWCYQYGLLPRITWPMTMYDMSLTTVEEVERKISRHLRKWLGLPPSFTRLGLYSRTARLQLPFTSVVEEFKVCKTRALMTLEGSKDEKVSQAGVELRSGRKWSVAKAVQEAKSSLRHRDIVGVVAQGRLGLGAGKTDHQSWCTAGPRERREMVQRETRRKEEEVRRAQAVSQGSQGAWTRWEGVKDRKVMWKELNRWEPLRLQFLLKSVYNLLPTPANKKMWGMQEEENCGLCGKRGSLSHILSGCPVALSQGRYRWRHDKVLRVLAAVLEEERTRNKQQVRKGPQFIGFLREGEVRKGKKERGKDVGILNTAKDWVLQVDLDKKLIFPEEVVTTSLRPDVILKSSQTKQVVLLELTVPWEERLEEAHERKALKYQELVQNCKDQGWKTQCFPVEVGTRGFIGQSVWKTLGAVGVNGKRRRDATRRLTEEAERSSRWIWIRSNERDWKGHD